MGDIEKCKNKAQFLVPWGGRQMKCCKQHAENITILGRAIGMAVQVAEVPMHDMCELNNDLEEGVE